MKTTKKFMALVLGLMFAMLVLPVSALTLDTAETVSEETFAVLAETSLKPGVNAFTGNTNAVTFETEDDLGFVTVVPRWDKTAVVDYKIGERTSYNGIGNSLMFKNTNGKTDASGHFVTRITATMPITVDRPSYFIARVCDANTHWYVSNQKIRSNGAGDWRNAELTKDYGTDAVLNSNSIAIDVWSLYGNNYYMYIDNIAMIPYYKITYKNVLPDGTTGEDVVAYYLDTESISVSTDDGVISGLPTSYTVDTSVSVQAPGMEFVGWSTEENATEVMETVALANEDIVLYPVWAEEETFDVLTPGINVFTGTAKAVTFETDADLKYVTATPKWDQTATVSSQIGERTAYNGIGNSFMFWNASGRTDASGHFVTSLKFKADVVVDRPAYFISRVCDAYTFWEYGGYIRQNKAGDWKNGYLAKDFGVSAVLNSDTVAWSVWSLGGNNYNMYIDNVALIPYYMITYKNILPDGTAGEDVVTYYLDTESISVSTNDGVIAGLPTSYTVDTSVTYEYGNMKLLGWSTEENATETMATVELANEDIVLYPVWGYNEEVVTPVTANTTEVRVAGDAGIRFKADVLYKVRQIKDKAVEYGFIVTTENHIGENELTFDSGVNYVYGKAYDNTTGLDKVYADGDEGVTITGVMTGIPNNKQSYTTKIIARSYVKIGDFYFYGNTYTDSLYDSVKRIDASVVAEIPYLQNVIDTVEG